MNSNNKQESGEKKGKKRLPLWMRAQIAKGRTEQEIISFLIYKLHA